jgi:RimJ/RimL family protein N-acetyltransferase
MSTLSSQRLSYSRLSAENLAAFHVLAIDEHIRRYLLDGQVVDLAWCEEQLAAGDALFAERHVGLWLAAVPEQPAAPLGFCGFIRFPETGPEPQLLYALLQPFTGQGFATEMATALVDYVRANTAAREIISAVDEPNAASYRVLEKIGFERTHTTPGMFGRILHFKYRLEPTS